MNKTQFAQICGILASILLIAGAILFAIGSPRQSLISFMLVAGLAVLALFIVLSAGIIRSFFGKRSSRFGANMLAMVILFTCIIAIAQILSLRHSKRIDLTKNARFSLASQTINLLRGLEDDISITAFFKTSTQEQMRAEDLISQYAYQTRRLSYEFIDPDRKPQLARSMGVTSYSTAVVARGEKKDIVTDLSEETLTNAILKVSKETVKTVYFLQGHGEKDPYGSENAGYSTVRQAIEKGGYGVRALSLFESESVPDDAYVVIVAGPVRDLFESEIEKLRSYLAYGRSVVFLIDPLTALPNVEALLAEHGLAVDDDVIIDPYNHIGRESSIPVVTQYVEHPITRGFTLNTVFPVARSVRITGDSGDAEVQYLALTGKFASAWGEKDIEKFRKGSAVQDETDVPAPVPIAAIASRPSDPGGTDAAPKRAFSGSKIVLIGDSDFAGNASFHYLGNADFFMNTISFLAEDEDLIAIRPKQGMGDRLFLTASQGRLVFLLSVVILPLSIITLGSTLFLRRRRRG